VGKFRVLSYSHRLVEDKEHRTWEDQSYFVIGSFRQTTIFIFETEVAIRIVRCLDWSITLFYFLICCCCCCCCLWGRVDWVKIWPIVIEQKVKAPSYLTMMGEKHSNHITRSNTGNRWLIEWLVSWSSKEDCKMKPSVGVEPTTLRLLSACSNQLSYEGELFHAPKAHCPRCLHITWANYHSHTHTYTP